MIDSTSHNTDYLLRKDLKENLTSQEKWDIFSKKLVNNRRKITEQTWNNIVLLDAAKNSIDLKVTRNTEDTIIKIVKIQEANASGK